MERLFWGLVRDEVYCPSGPNALQRKDVQNNFRICLEHRCHDVTRESDGHICNGIDTMFYLSRSLTQSMTNRRILESEEIVKNIAFLNGGC